MKIEGSNITINDSVYNKMAIIPKGACEQEGTPTPDAPIPVKVVTGDNSFLVQNKNLFKLTGTNTTSNATKIYLDNGLRVTSGSGSGPCYVVYTINNIKPNTQYSIKCNESMSSEDDYAGILFRERQGNTNISTYTILPTDSVISRTITTTANTDNIRLYFYSKQAGNGAYTDYTNIQLEIASSPTDYVEHAEQTYTLHLGSNYLAGIGDYKDEIVGKTDNWKIKRKVRKLDLAIADMNNMENYPGWRGQNQLVIDLNLTSSNVKLNNITSLLNNIGANYLYANSNTDGVFWIDRNSFGNEYTQTYWKTNYPNLIFEMYYGIINEQAQTEIPVTDTTLITDLNNMYQALSYDGTTNITITSNPNNAQMTAEVTYTSKSDMCEKLLFIFNKMKDKLYHIIRSL